MSPTMSPVADTRSVASERDREVLRSFARRIDPSDAGAHNNLGVLYYNKGLCTRRRSRRSCARSSSTRRCRSRSATSRSRISTRGYYDDRVAELRERLRARPSDRDARWELGRTHALLGQHAEAVARVHASSCKYHPKRHRRARPARSRRKDDRRPRSRAGMFERALALDPNSSRGALLPRRGALQPRG